MEPVTKTFTNAPTLAERAHNHPPHMRSAWARCRVRATSRRLSTSPTYLPAAYFHAMPLSAGRSGPGKDATVSCCQMGHYAIALYAALIEAGIVPEAELETYGFDESRLPMSGMASYTPGMEMSGGSLGLGLSIAVGMGAWIEAQGLHSAGLHPFLRRRAR